MIKHEETQKKSTNIKSLTKIVWFEQFPELDRIGHGADVVGQSVPGSRTHCASLLIVAISNYLYI